MTCDLAMLVPVLGTFDPALYLCAWEEATDDRNVWVLATNERDMGGVLGF